MMFFLGYVAIIQIVFLPGFIFLELFNFKNVGFKIPLVFATSLLLNYILVFVLILLGIYKQNVVLSIFGVELITAIWIIQSRNLISSWRSMVTEIRIKASNLDQYLSSENSTINNLKFLSALLSFSIVVWFLFAIPANVLDNFQSWDALRSWNRWAVELFGSNLEFNSYNYPMLLSSNWSLTYSFMGSAELTFAAAAIDRIFVFMLFFVTIQWGWRCYSSASFLIAPILLLTLFTFVSKTGIISTSLADIPIAFMATLALAQIDYSFMKSEKIGSYKCTPEILGAFIAITAAAVTKQAGLFLLIGAPILIFLLHKHSMKKTMPTKGKLVIFFWVVSLMLVLPWYLHARYLMSIGLNSSEVSWVMNGIHGSLSFVDRFASWMSGLTPASLPGLSIVCIGVIVLFFRTRLSIISGFCFLYILLWAALLSYDGRNAMLGVPGMVVAASVVLREWLNLGVTKLQLDTPKGKFIKSHFGKLIFVGVLMPIFFWGLNYNYLLYKIDDYAISHQKMDHDLGAIRDSHHVIGLSLAATNIYTEESAICPYVKLPTQCTTDLDKWLASSTDMKRAIVLYKNSPVPPEIGQKMTRLIPSFDPINDRFKIFIFE